MSTDKQSALCPVCQRGDIWQEAVNRTQYVYDDPYGKEIISYLLSEVASMLEAHKQLIHAAKGKVNALHRH